MTEDAILGSLAERKAISNYLVIMAARAMIRHSKAPIWKPIMALKQKWIAVCLSMAAEMVERGDHLSEQARWVADIEGGAAVQRGIDAALSQSAEG